MRMLIERIKAKLNFIKNIIKQVTPAQKDLMTDQEFQAGMTAAVQTYFSSLNGSFPVSEFSYTYTPSVSTPPAETVDVSF